MSTCQRIKSCYSILYEDLLTMVDQMVDVVIDPRKNHLMTRVQINSHLEKISQMLSYLNPDFINRLVFYQKVTCRFTIGKCHHYLSHDFDGGIDVLPGTVLILQ